MSENVLSYGLCSFGAAAQDSGDRVRGAGLTIIIPVAGLGKRMKSYGAKALIELRPGQTVLSRQLTLLRTAYPFAEIVVVVGYDADRVYRSLPARVRVVENEFHDETNVARSIDLGLRATVNERVLIVYGDLVFSANTLERLSLLNSSVLVDDKEQFGEHEVGVTVIGGEITQFSYGLPTKWGQISFLTGPELSLLRRFVADRDKRKCFGFEAMNYVLERGGKFGASFIGDGSIAEIDTSKDIERAVRVQ